MSVFDGLSVNMDKTAKLYLTGLKGKPLIFNDVESEEKDDYQAWIELHSSSSTIATQHQEKLGKKTFNAQMSRRKRDSIEYDDVLEQQIELLIALTVDWHLCDFDGNALDVECNEKNKREFYTNQNLKFIRDQVDAFIDDEQVFIES